MADDTKIYTLLSTGMFIDGVEYATGDPVELPTERGEALAAIGAVEAAEDKPAKRHRATAS
jgi:hypothetical protein